MSALIHAQTRKLRAQLLGAMVCRQATEPPQQRLHFGRAVEPKESAEGRWISFLEMLGSLDAQQCHKQEGQQGTALPVNGSGIANGVPSRRP
jgi:hypothetical protein